MRNQINFNHLECFFSFAKTLSFSKTSQELKIAQPAVSKQIKALEESFSFQLFYRSRQHVQMTVKGEELYNQIWPLYNEITSRISRTMEESDELQGEIRFGCLEEVGEKVFIPALTAFRSQHPKIRFEVLFMKAFEIIE